MRSVKTFQWWRCKVWSSGTKRQKQTTWPPVGQVTGKRGSWGPQTLNTRLRLLCKYLRRHQVLFLSLCRLWVCVSLILEKCSPLRKKRASNLVTNLIYKRLLAVKMHIQTSRRKINNAILSQEASVSLWKFKLTQSSKPWIKKKKSLYKPYLLKSLLNIFFILWHSTNPWLFFKLERLCPRISLIAL